MNLEHGKAVGFDDACSLPQSEARRGEWQRANRSWWEANPMRYDWNAPVPGVQGERSWFEEIDRRSFYIHVVPQQRLPFDGLIPFADLGKMDVLEIGVGMGTHAQLLASAARSFTGVDITRTAVEITRKRFKVFRLQGKLLQMDAENLAFPSQSFDLVWSWGVIHHSANTRNVLGEIRRVLRSHGEARVMVYHKAFVPWYLYDGFLRGVLQGRLLKYGSVSSVVQSITDGALARYYTRAGWREIVAGLFDVIECNSYGNRAELIPIPASSLKDKIVAALPDSFYRFWLTRMRQGRLLYTRLRPLG